MTKSLCPICFKPLDAEVFDEDGKILIKKTCDEHGEFVNTYWSDDKLYNRVKQFEPTITSVENPSVEKFGDCPNNCGLCEDHETSTVLGLIDVTNRCNLRCPVCFANAAVSGRLYEPTQDEIREIKRIVSKNTVIQKCLDLIVISYSPVTKYSQPYCNIIMTIK